MNSGISELINRAQQERDNEGGVKPFAFNTALDSAGIPLESKDYARQECRKCHGKGVVRYLVITEKRRGVVGGPKDEVCICVHKGYTRARRRVESLAEFVSKKMAATVEDTLVGQPPA